MGVESVHNSIWKIAIFDLENRYEHSGNPMSVISRRKRLILRR